MQVCSSTFFGAVDVPLRNCSLTNMGAYRRGQGGGGSCPSLEMWNVLFFVLHM